MSDDELSSHLHHFTILLIFFYGFQLLNIFLMLNCVAAKLFQNIPQNKAELNKY